MFFWRWPLEYMSDALYGVPPLFEKARPAYWTPQPSYAEKGHKELVKAKVDKVRQRGYLRDCCQKDIDSLMYMFDVPKGEHDIRMVYDGSKSGLNDALWAPWFPLPSPEAFFDTIEPGSWLSDNDMGEFFLNYPIDRKSVV